MYEQLYAFLKRPEPFSRHTVKELWTRKHLATQMLNAHLDSESNRASRRSETILTSVAWIDQQLNLSGKKLCDLGCGPGLYAARFESSGAEVTAIDFSRTALDYAKSAAKKTGSSINYLEADYLNDELPKCFDIVSLIYCDYCVLSPEQRKKLLTKIHGMLNSGGKFVLDVGALHQFDKINPKAELATNLGNGFWAPSDYIAVHKTIKYQDIGLALDHFLIIEPQQSWEIYNWFQYFSPTSIQSELEAAGFSVSLMSEALTGEELKKDSDEICLICCKN